MKKNCRIGTGVLWTGQSYIGAAKPSFLSGNTLPVPETPEAQAKMFLRHSTALPLYRPKKKGTISFPLMGTSSLFRRGQQ